MTKNCAKVLNKKAADKPAPGVLGFGSLKIPKDTRLLGDPKSDIPANDYTKWLLSRVKNKFPKAIDPRLALNGFKYGVPISASTLKDMRAGQVKSIIDELHKIAPLDHKTKEAVFAAGMRAGERNLKNFNKPEQDQVEQTEYPSGLNEEQQKSFAEWQKLIANNTKQKGLGLV